MKYRIAGKECLLAVGAYPATSLVQVREARDEARAQIAQRSDSKEEKRDRQLKAKESNECTFSKVAKKYIFKFTNEGRADTTLIKIYWLMNIGIADLGSKPIAEITSPIVLQVLRKVENKGNYESALRLRSTIGAVFRYAIANGLAENEPTFALLDALISPKIKPRAAITDKIALGGLMRAIDGLDGQIITKIALELLAIVVMRPGEVRHACWKEYDLESAIWTVEQQRLIVEKLDFLNETTDQVETLFQQKLTDLDELRQSLLQKAFAGE